jgi:hypothetical protein
MQTGTTEENKAVVQGSLAYFGTDTVDEAAKIISTHMTAAHSQTGSEPTENSPSI